MFEKFDDYGVPLDFLERNSLRIYFGRDWPADIFGALEEYFGDQSFDVYIDVAGEVERQSTGMDLGNAQLAASDNVANGTLLAAPSIVYIYVTDDNDIFYLCAPEKTLISILDYLDDCGIMTDTKRLSLSPNLLREGILDFYEHFSRYNVETA